MITMPFSLMKKATWREVKLTMAIQKCQMSKMSNKENYVQNSANENKIFLVNQKLLRPRLQCFLQIFERVIVAKNSEKSLIY